MQIVIEIPKEAYELLQTDGVDWLGAEHILDAVANGTPLPEHHSDLIERSSLDVDNLDRAYDSNFELDFGRLYTLDVVKMIEKAPTIIPATKEEKQIEKSCKDCAHINFNKDCKDCFNHANWIPKQTATKEGAE